MSNLEKADKKNELNLDHVNVITERDLMDFLGIDGFYKRLYEQISYLSYNSDDFNVAFNFELDYLHKFTMDIWKYSREHLTLVKGE